MFYCIFFLCVATAVLRHKCMY